MIIDKMFKRFQFKLFDALVTIKIVITPLSEVARLPGNVLGVEADPGQPERRKEVAYEPGRKIHKHLTFKPFENLFSDDDEIFRRCYVSRKDFLEGKHD